MAHQADASRRIVRAAGLFYSGMAALAVGIALLVGRRGGLFGPQAPEAWGLAVGVALGLSVVWLSRLGARLSPALLRASDHLGSLLGPITPLQAVFLAAVSGFAEELLFRGALWPLLGLWGTTLLFGAVHYIPVRELRSYPLFAAVMGLLLGLLRKKTGSVFPEMAAHATINGFNLAWLGARQRAIAAARGAETEDPPFPEPPPPEGGGFSDTDQERW